MQDVATLDRLPLATEAYIHSLDISGSARQRLSDLGFVAGNRIVPVLKSPLGDPVAYLVMGSIIALRQEDAANIKISVAGEACPT